MMIVFVLFSGATWAADFDEIDLAADVQSAAATAALASPSTHSETQKAPADVPCDHCCHGAAHYVGFPSESQTVLTHPSNAFPLVRPVARDTRSKEPPFHPPKV